MYCLLTIACLLTSRPQRVGRIYKSGGPTWAPTRSHTYVYVYMLCTYVTYCYDMYMTCTYVYIYMICTYVAQDALVRHGRVPSTRPIRSLARFFNPVVVIVSGNRLRSGVTSPNSFSVCVQAGMCMCLLRVIVPFLWIIVALDLFAHGCAPSQLHTLTISHLHNVQIPTNLEQYVRAQGVAPCTTNS